MAENGTVSEAGDGEGKGNGTSSVAAGGAGRGNLGWCAGVWIGLWMGPMLSWT